MRKILFKTENCAGCNICAIACMDQNDYQPSSGTEPFRKVFCTEKDGIQRFRSQACTHCGLCIDSCPLGCIRRDPDTGFVIADPAGCTGCGACSTVCPVSAPQICGGVMCKCDGCNERVKAGLAPACVRACPTGALSFE